MAGTRAPLTFVYFIFFVKKAAIVGCSVGGSTVFAFGLQPYIGGHAHLLPFTLAVIISAWYADLSGGLSATVLGFLVAGYLFIDPKLQFGRLTAVHAALLLLYLAVGTSISLSKAALARINKGLQRIVESLNEVKQRHELASCHGMIGFQDYLAGPGQANLDA
jgi:hypothetical protein